MMRSLYSGVSGLKTHQTQMDVIGNNIANVNTYAYKTQRATFQDMYYQTIRPSSNSGTNALQLGYGSQVGSVDVMHQPTGFMSTDRALDLYIDGEGYFVVNDPSTTDGEMLTRNGAFSFVPDATDQTTFRLVDVSGNGVYGMMATVPNPAAPTSPFPAATTPGEIDEANMVELTVANFSSYTSISIGQDGVVTGLNANNEIITLARLAVAEVSNPEGLTMIGGSYYRAEANTGEVLFNEAGENGVGGLVSGALEMSGVDLASEFTSMIITQRGYQANSRIITTVDSMLEELVNLKR